MYFLSAFHFDLLHTQVHPSKSIISDHQFQIQVKVTFQNPWCHLEARIRRFSYLVSRLVIGELWQLVSMPVIEGTHPSSHHNHHSNVSDWGFGALILLSLADGRIVLTHIWNFAASQYLIVFQLQTDFWYRQDWCLLSKNL